MNKKIWSTVLSTVMTISLLAGCGGGSEQQNKDTQESKGGQESTAESAGESLQDTDNQTADTGDVVTLTLLTTKISSNITNYPDTEIINAMADAIGVKINLIEADTDKYNVYMASGEGFDMILSATTNFNQLIDGNVVVPMDEYLEGYGSDIRANIADTVEFSKANWSNGTDQLYFLPVQIGVDSPGIAQAMGLSTRWDYYKEMGYPEISSIDDWLEMLAEMQDKYPTTEEGLPVYGVSMFADWGIWCYKYPLACVNGYNELSGSASGLYKPSTMEYSNLLEENGLFWDSVAYYYKANQLGILDPDAFITNYDDFTAKAANGQLLTGPALWSLTDYNAKHNDEAVGFQVIPTTWANQWGSTDYKAGWVDKCFGISATTKYPEKAMAFINYVYSYEGCRLLYSGIEGKHYTMEGGVPVLTEDSVELYLKKGSDEWKESGLGFDGNIIGLGTYTVNPEDGKTLDLFADPSVYAEMMTPLQQDFSDYYQVSYPDEIFQQYREKYDVYDQSNTDSFAVALVSTAPDDITRKEARLVEAATSAASKIVLAASQEEYDSLKQQTIDEFNNIGLQDVIDWYTNEWGNAVESAKAFVEE